MQKTANYYPLQHLEENVHYDPDSTREKILKALESRKMPKGGKVYTFEEFQKLNLLSNNHS